MILEILDVNSGQKGVLVYCAKNKHENGKVLLIKGLIDAGGEITIEATIDVGEYPIFEVMDFELATLSRLSSLFRECSYR